MPMNTPSLRFVWSNAIEREPIKTDPDGLAEIWRTAEQRRAKDISGWLGQLFDQRRRPRVADGEAAYPQGYSRAHFLRMFRATTGQTPHLALRERQCQPPVTVNVRVGSVMPVLWSATGRAFGAFSKAAVLQPLIQTELASASPENRKTHRRRSCPPPQIK
jgi:hypothetical protein